MSVRAADVFARGGVDGDSANGYDGEGADQAYHSRPCPTASSHGRDAASGCRALRCSHRCFTATGSGGSRTSQPAPAFESATGSVGTDSCRHQSAVSCAPITSGTGQPRFYAARGIYRGAREPVSSRQPHNGCAGRRLQTTPASSPGPTTALAMETMGSVVSGSGHPGRSSGGANTLPGGEALLGRFAEC